DPAGATLCLWQPGRTIGAGRVNEPGCLTWNELHVPDIGAAASFYGELFGWTTEAMQTGSGPEYHVIRNGERSNGGITSTQRGDGGVEARVPLAHVAHAPVQGIGQPPGVAGARLAQRLDAEHLGGPRALGPARVVARLAVRVRLAGVDGDQPPVIQRERDVG